MRGSRRVGLVAALGSAAALACATLGEPSPPPGPPAFAGVKKVLVVRSRPDRDGARAKDALDAFAESLASRGYEVTRVELGSRPPAELRGLERLYTRIDAYIASGQPRPRYARPVEGAGSDAGEVVRSAGADAVAMYHRFDDRLLMPFQDAPMGGSFFPQPPRVDAPGLRRPAGAISLVDRSGNATWFSWGSPGAELDSTQPINAAEAIDMALRALRGEAAEETDGG